MGALASRSANAAADAEAQQAAAEAAATRGLYFGPHFVMGGQRFGAAPDSFLFGGLTADFTPVTAFGLNRMGQPTPEMHTTTTLRSHVNLKRGTLKFVAVPETSPQRYKLSFVFDCDTPCSIQIFVVCTESVGADGNVVYASRHPEGASPVFNFGTGIGQTFTLPDENLLSFAQYSMDELQVDSDRHPRGLYPVIILMRALPETDDEARGAAADALATSSTQTQSTLATLVAHDDTGLLEMRVLKQKIMVQGVAYLLQEIYGIDQGTDGTSEGDDSMENTRECVVCMSDPKDTTVLPCRHLCLCAQCAEQLRYQSNKCPICRQPFHSLLQIKIGEAKPTDVTAEAGAPQPATAATTINVEDDEAQPSSASAAIPSATVASAAAGADSAMDVFNMAAQTGEAPLSILSTAAHAQTVSVVPSTTYVPLTSFAEKPAVRAGGTSAVQRTIVAEESDDDADDRRVSSEDALSGDELASSGDELASSGDELGGVGSSAALVDPLGANKLKKKKKAKKPAEGAADPTRPKKTKKASGKAKERASLDQERASLDRSTGADEVTKKRVKNGSSSEAPAATSKPKKKVAKKRLAGDSAVDVSVSHSADGVVTTSFVNPTAEVVGSSVAADAEPTDTSIRAETDELSYF